MVDKMFIMQGASGCGKSTFINDNNLHGYVISPDEIRGIINPSPEVYDRVSRSIVHGYDFSGRTSAEAFRIAQSICAARMKKGETIIIDSVAARRRTIGGFLHEAQVYGYAVKYVDMQENLTLDEIMKRNDSRGIRAIPHDVVENQYRNCNEYRIEKNEEKITRAQMMSMSLVKEHNLDAFDTVSIVGDIQGCFSTFRHSGRNENKDGEFIIFAGDLFDRGPDDEAAPMFDWLLGHHQDEDKAFVIGNHDSYLRFYGDDAHGDYGESTQTTISHIMHDSTMVGNSPKRLHRFSNAIYRSMVPMYAFSFHDRHYVVTHGGMHPSVFDDARVEGGYKLGFNSDQSFWYGTGTTVNTGDYDIDIDDIIEHERHDDSPIQIHGHRNEHHHALNDYRHVYNLETQVEHGGFLSIVRIDGNGINTEQYQ